MRQELHDAASPQQYGEGCFIHLQAIPVRTPVEPHILRPAAIGLLSDLEVMQNANSVSSGAGGNKAASSFDQIPWPDQVISAQIFIAFVEAPRNGKAGDYPAKKVLRLMDAQ